LNPADFDYQNCPHLDLILLPGGFGTVDELGNQAILSFLKAGFKQVDG